MSFVRDAPMVGQEYMWDGDGEELGSLKNEADELFDEPTSHPEYSAESSISFDDARISVRDLIFGGGAGAGAMAKLARWRA